MPQNAGVQVVVVPEAGGSGLVRGAGVDGRVPDLAAAMASLEAERHPRWILPAADELYPALLRSGVRLGRCHDLALTEGILLVANRSILGVS